MSKPISPLESFLVRYNFVLLVIIAAGMLSASIYLAYNTFDTASNPANAEVKSDIPGNFDTATRERIDKLHKSDEHNISTTPPAGRINPFAE